MYMYIHDYNVELFCPDNLKKHFSFSSYMEIAVHVEADDAEVVGTGHVGDDALSAFPLLRHSHPHVPVPQLQHTHKHTQLIYS